MPRHKGKNGKGRGGKKKEIERKGKIMKKEETKEERVSQGKMRGVKRTERQAWQRERSLRP